MEWSPTRAYKFVFYKAKCMHYDNKYDSMSNHGTRILRNLLDDRIPYVRKMEIICLFVDVFDYFIKKDLFLTKEKFISDVEVLFGTTNSVAKKWARESMLDIFR